MKPGTNGRKKETTEQFAARMGKEFREEAKRIKKATEIHANREAQRILREGEEKVKHLRKVASQFDGKRS
jgi:hypothetical protein